MKVVAIQSLFPGAGGTSITAHLMTALEKSQQTVLGIDLCPYNDLRLWFGMPRNELTGWTTASGELAQAMQQHRQSSEFGVSYIPTGEAGFTANDIVRKFCGSDSPLSANTFEKSPDILLLNLPSADAYALQRLLPLSDLVLQVWAPEPRVSYRLQQFVRDNSFVASDIPHSLFFLENLQAPALELNNDISAIIREQLSDQAQVPACVSRDQHICEALATQQTTFEYSAGSAANREFLTIAKWVCNELGVS